jgi:hypothetical protein
MLAFDDVIRPEPGYTTPGLLEFEGANFWYRSTFPLCFGVYGFTR